MVVITPEETISGEHLILNQMLSFFPLLRIHIRKPTYSLEEMDAFLERLNLKNYSHISVHSGTAFLHHKFGCQLHAKEIDRLKNDCSFNYTSTSVHSRTEFIQLHEQYSYLFCSPIFQSISKLRYFPTEEWDLTMLPTEIQKKAVGLGGISFEQLPQLKKKGFKNAAFLGTIWNSENPLKEMEKITRTFEDIYTNKLYA